MYESEAVTRGIRVRVESMYDPGRSTPHAGHWFFLYTVTLVNEGSETMQLLSRHWVITDGNGKVNEVRGEGVVGEKPVLLPGGTFSYTSGCPLPTAFGSMQGSYTMQAPGGELFEAEIALFALGELTSVH